jgi:hypothetical protein
MNHVVSKRRGSFADIIHQDVKAVFDFLYGTPDRSRKTVIICLMVFAYYVIGSSIHGLAQAQGTCGL